MKEEWYHFKKTFTQEQEDVLWQYFIDHSKIQPNGYLGIMFYIKDIDDFWRRLFARKNGFARYEKVDKGIKIKKFQDLGADIGNGRRFQSIHAKLEDRWYTRYIYRILLKMI